MIFGLLLASAVGVHLEEVGELPMENALSVVEALSGAVERRTGRRPILDELAWSTCDAPDRCLGEIRGRTHAEDVLFVRVFGGPSMIHVVIDRAAMDPAASRSAELDLGRRAEDLASWPGALDGAVATLLPDAVRVVEQKPPIIVEQPVAPERSPAPWIIAGAGIAAGVAGALLGASSANAKSELESGVHLEREKDELTSRMETNGTAANILFVGAAAAIATGAAWLILE